MRRLLSAVITAILIFTMIALPAGAARPSRAQSGDRVVGGMRYVSAGIERQVQVALREDGSYEARGLLHYSDEFGEWYKVYLQSAEVIDGQAFFAGEVVAASQPEWVGLWFSGAVVDGGEPGEGVDLFAGAFATEGQARTNVQARVVPDQLQPISDGNILVYLL